MAIQPGEPFVRDIRRHPVENDRVTLLEVAVRSGRPTSVVQGGLQPLFHRAQPWGCVLEHHGAAERVRIVRGHEFKRFGVGHGAFGSLEQAARGGPAARDIGVTAERVLLSAFCLLV